MVKRPPKRRSSALPIGIVAALLLVASGLVGLIEMSAPSERPVPIGGGFSLVDGTGKPVSDRDFLGRHVLIYFGYTRCRDVCPATLATVAAALDGLGERADRLRALFISVDPARDTPAAVERFVSGISTKLIGLTGSPEALSQVARAYHVASVIHGGDPETALIDHDSVLYLIGPDGRYLAPIAADSSVAEMTRVLADRLR